jgi:hypothetical protein
MIAATTRRIAATCTVIGLAAIGVAAIPKPANAWWHGYGWGVGIYVPPIVVAPPPAYYPAPAYYPTPTYYAPSASAWIPAHWQGNYWVPGHWS